MNNLDTANMKPARQIPCDPAVWMLIGVVWKWHQTLGYSENENLRNLLVGVHAPRSLDADGAWMQNCLKPA